MPQDILAIIKGETKTDFMNISSSSDICQVSGKAISVHSPVSLNIYDENGNHTGITGGGNVEYGINGVSFDEIEGEKFAFLPDGLNYKIILNGESSGTFDFNIEDISGIDEISNEESWLSVPIEGTSSRFEINIGTSTEHFIIADEKGDGNSIEDLAEGYDGSTTTVHGKRRRGMVTNMNVMNLDINNISSSSIITNVFASTAKQSSSSFATSTEISTTIEATKPKIKEKQLSLIKNKVAKISSTKLKEVNNTATTLNAEGSSYFFKVIDYVKNLISKIIHKVVK